MAVKGEGKDNRHDDDDDDDRGDRERWPVVRLRG